MAVACTHHHFVGVPGQGVATLAAGQQVAVPWAQERSAAPGPVHMHPHVVLLAYLQQHHPCRSWVFKCALRGPSVRPLP